MTLRKHKNKLDYGSQYFYNEFKKRNKDSIVTQKIYTLILKTLFELVVKKIVTKAYRFSFPGIGLFYLIRVKQKIKKDPKTGKVRLQSSVNWPETKRIGKKVYYMNDNTDRNVYKICWDKTIIHFVNKSFYTFEYNKKHKQFLNEAIKASDKLLNAYLPWYQ